MLVQTKYGPVDGFRDTKPIVQVAGQSDVRPAVAKWLGIPFARASRFCKPEPPAPWTEPLEVKTYGAHFPECGLTDANLIKKRNEAYDARPDLPVSEEGHFLNIYGPGDLKPEQEKLPVLCWIYGGALVNGHASQHLDDASEWIRRAQEEDRQRIVIAAFNYRTGIFGFFSSPELVAEGQQNFGLYDCVSALEWVQDNISAFGGDPSNVTIFGESAGSFISSLLLVSGRRLFKRAILQSGAPTTIPLRKPEQSFTLLQAVYDECCPDVPPKDRLSHLRSLSTNELHDAFCKLYGGVGGGVSPVAPGLEPEGGVWTEDPQAKIERGEWDPWIEAVIIGTNTDEGALFCLDSPLCTVEAFKALVASHPAEKHRALEAAYTIPDGPITPLNSPAGKLFGDLIFHVPALRLARALAGTKHKETGKPLPVYMYRLDGECDAVTKGPTPLGACHACDIPLVFNLNSLWDADSTDAVISKAMGTRWAAFATSGTPSDDWEVFTKDGQSALVFEKDGGVRNEGLKDWKKEAFEIFGRA